MIKISIVIPIYNMEQYIEPGLNRIIKQELEDIEIILVNDGSTDGSREICDKYARFNDKIKVIHKQNGGAGSARNKGIEVAQGKYIMFFDIDDIIEDEMLTSMFNTIENNEVDLVICNHNLIKNNTIIHNAKGVFESYSVIGKKECRDSYVDLLKKSLIQTPWDKIYKLEIIRKNNLKFTDLRRCQDAVFNCNYFTYVKSYRVIKDCLYNYKENDLQNRWDKFPVEYFDICLALDQTYTYAVRDWGTSTEEKEKYLATYFLDEVMQCIKYSFSPKWNFNSKKRRNYIKSILNNTRVIEAIPLYEPTSLYKKIMIFLMKTKYVIGIILAVKLNVYIKLKMLNFCNN